MNHFIFVVLVTFLSITTTALIIALVAVKFSQVHSRTHKKELKSRIKDQKNC